MGIFNSLFSKQEQDKESSNIRWIPFNNMDQIEEIKQLSTTEPVLIFKHSTRCGISRMVIKQFEKKFTEDMKDLKVYYLDLLNYRSISDEVGYTFQVRHESPQLLIIKNGVAVANASHYDITTVNLN